MPDMNLPVGKVVLFSGYMIDAPGRKNPRFPPGSEQIAARAIEEAMADRSHQLFISTQVLASAQHGYSSGAARVWLISRPRPPRR
jgi:hypothetical protein